jgi:hypothetical protein
VLSAIFAGEKLCGRDGGGEPGWRTVRCGVSGVWRRREMWRWRFDVAVRLLDATWTSSPADFLIESTKIAWDGIPRKRYCVRTFSVSVSVDENVGSLVSLTISEILRQN